MYTPRLSAVGAAYDDLNRAVANVSTVAAATTKILSDPALGEVAALILELQLYARDEQSGGGAGIGLKDIVTPLKYYVALKRNPSLGWLGLGALIGMPFLLGYSLGLSRRR
jgi:hypothetical protein